MGNLKNQKGIVLVAAMLMILMVSGIAVTVMSGSALDSKMINATQDSYRAESITRGDTEKSIKDELAKKGNSQFLLKRSNAAYVKDSITLLSGSTKVVMVNEVGGPQELLDCPPRFAPTPNISCNFLKLTTSRAYGKNDKHTMTINTGIQQEMIGGQ